MSMKNLVQQLISTTKASVQANNMQGRSEVTTLAFSAESLDENVKASALASKELLNNIVDQSIMMVLGNEEFKFNKITTAQKDAARLVVSLAMDPVAATMHMKSLKPYSGVVISAEAMGVDDILDANSLSTEAFDGQAINNALYYSIAFNIGAAKQDAFCEAFMPTLTLDPTQSGITVDTEFTSLYTDFERSITGTPDIKKFNKKPLVKAIYDENIFTSDKTRVVPVMRDSNKVLMVESEAYVDQNTGSDIVTAPLVFGKTIGLLGISQTDAMLAKGMFDSTDALDRTLKLERVYYSLSGKNSNGDAVTEIFRADIGLLPYSNFTYSVQDHFKNLSLSFTTESVIISTTNTKPSKLGSSAILGALGDHIIKLGIKLHGEANTQHGDISVYSSNVEVVEIRNAAGDVIPSTSADYLAVMGVMNTIKLVGYTVEAYRTNSNLRTIGQLATVDSHTQSYIVPLRSGSTMLLPENNVGQTDGDASKLAGQIQIANMKSSVAGIKAMLDFANTLKSLTANGLDNSAELSCLGRWHVSTKFIESAVDISKYVDSVKSNERLIDIKAALVNKIKDTVLRLYIESGYNIAFEAANGNTGIKPTVIIGTDTNIRQYLLSGDGQVNLGDEFDVVVVSTPNPAMYGKIMLSFGVFTEKRNSEVNPLNFGNMLWSPTFCTDIARNYNGAYRRELHNIPRYLHIFNLPILGMLYVTGIDVSLGKITANRKAM